MYYNIMTKQNLDYIARKEKCEKFYHSKKVKGFIHEHRVGEE